MTTSANKENNNNNNNNKKKCYNIRLFVYILLLLLRFVCTVTKGYIHPDEFFQGGQELFFARHRPQQCDDDNQDDDNGGSFTTTTTTTTTTKVATNISSSMHSNVKAPSWEFEPKNAIRSIVPPVLLVKLPLGIYQFVKRRLLYMAHLSSPELEEEKDMLLLSGMEIWIVPRIFIAFLSIFMMDFSIWIIVITYKRQQQQQKHLDSSTFKTLSSPLSSTTNDTSNDNVTTMMIPMELLIFSSSWTTLLFLNRPFSNTLETFLLSSLLAVFVADYNYCFTQINNGDDNENIISNNTINNNASFYFSTRSIIVGILSSAGLFTRFTFAFFALPVVLAFLHYRGLYHHHFYHDKTDNDCHQPKNLLQVTTNYIFNIVKSSTFILLVTSFLMTSIVFILLDTQFYRAILSSSKSLQEHEEEEEDGDASYPRFFITPYNALKYNSNVHNLSEHGIHPRFTHALVNMTMLYGPLVWLFYCNVIVNAASSGIAKRKKEQHERQRSEQHTQQTTTTTNNDDERTAKEERRDKVNRENVAIIDHVCTFVIIFGLSILSMAPHQEPRFLLPLTVPLVVLHGRNVLSPVSPKLSLFYANKDKERKEKETRKNHETSFSFFGLTFWVAFNFLLFVFFGLWHQSGIVPSLLDMERVIEEGAQQRHTQHQDFLQCNQDAEMESSACNFNDKHDLVITTDTATLSRRSIFENQPKAVLYYHTYMPPTFLSRRGLLPFVYENHKELTSSFRCSRRWPIIDLKGSDKKVLLGMLDQYLSCGMSKKGGDNDEREYGDNDDNNGVGINATENNGHLYIIAPPVTLSEYISTTTIGNGNKKKKDHSNHSNRGINPNELPLDHPCSYIEQQNYRCKQVWSYGSHVTTEDMPHWKGSLADFWLEMQLSYYEISCRSSESMTTS